MSIMKVNIMKEENNKDKTLEELESTPVLTPPFENQENECEISIPEEESIQ